MRALRAFSRYFTDYEFRAAINGRHPVSGRIVFLTLLGSPWFVLLWLVGASEWQYWFLLGACLVGDIAAMLYYFQVEAPLDRPAHRAALQSALTGPKVISRADVWMARRSEPMTVLGVGLIVSAALLNKVLVGTLAFPPAQAFIVAIAGVILLFKVHRAKRT